VLEAEIPGLEQVTGKHFSVRTKIESAIAREASSFFPLQNCIQPAIHLELLLVTVPRRDNVFLSCRLAADQCNEPLVRRAVICTAQMQWFLRAVRQMYRLVASQCSGSIWLRWHGPFFLICRIDLRLTHHEKESFGATA
jgi:hypothetical protein